ncbi:MAG: beta strand repeat-containing protein, partial [Chthoniobacterales bacterium]
TIFSGNITGPGFMQIINGREVFSGNVSNTGGFYIGRQGNTAQVTFNGTTSGSVPLILSGGSNNRTSYTPGALPTGTITTDIVDSSSIPFLVPLGNSTINNVMNLSPVYNTLTGALIAGAGTIGADVGNGINATWAGPISGVGGLVKNGVGTLTLSGADTYAGSTTVGNGTLVLDYNANNTSYLGDGAALILGGTGGGTLNLSGGSHTEVVASTTLNAGANSVIQTGGSSTLQMNAITRNAGSTLNVGNGSTATTDTSNLGGNGILGGYATVGATTNSADWATSVNTGAADTAVTAFTTYDSFATSGTDNNNPLLTGSSALTGNLTTNSLKINSSAAGQSLDVVNTQTLTLNSGGLMFVGANDYQINNGTIKSGTATNSDLIVQQWGAGTLTINSVIANGTGTSTLTKAGTGTLALGAQNTYTGITYVNGGTLLANNATSSTGSGAVMVNTGGTLAGTGKVTGAVTVNGGTIGGSVNMGSTVTVNNGGTVGGSGSITGAATVNTGGTLGGTENIAGAVTVNYGGTISPGNGIGTLNTGNLTLSGTYLAEINLNNGGAASADLLNITGTVKINAGVLTLSLSNTAGFTGGTFLLVANDGTDAITGTLSSITGLPAGYSATVDYAYSGTDSLGRVGTDNDLAVTIAVPEPQSYVLLGLGAFALLFRGRRRI